MTICTDKGTLYLVPTPLDFGCGQQVPLQDCIPEGTLRIAARLRHWIGENAKSTRAYLKRIHAIHPLGLPLQEVQIQELPRTVHKKGDHLRTHASAIAWLQPALHGMDIGLCSEAGMPAIADPGSSVVRAAHQLGLNVVALTGPISLMLALAASGLNGQNFAFAGYLPQEAAERTARIRALEAVALKTGQSQLFIEAPYRNAALLQALLGALQHNTRLSISHGLTLSSQHTRSALVGAWRKNPADGAPSNDAPAIFAFGR